MTTIGRSSDLARSAAMSEPIRAAGLLVASGDGPGDLPAGDLVAAARRGHLRRIGRGAYVGVRTWDGLDPTSRHVLAVRAALTGRPELMVSHWSAAALLGLPIVGRRDDDVHLTIGPTGGGRTSGRLRRHQAEGEVTETVVDGMRLTSPARTLVDLACDVGVLASVVAGDAALRAGLVVRDALDEELDRAAGRRGVRQARRAVTLMNGAAESPGESLSRVRIAELGFPPPVLQHEIRDRSGFVARVDFWWEDHALAGEFDGRSKYGLDKPAAAGEALWREKIREDTVRALGVRMARWTWDDAWHAEPLARILRAAGLR
jgi:hypothetical protein